MLEIIFLFFIFIFSWNKKIRPLYMFFFLAGYPGLEIMGLKFLYLIIAYFFIDLLLFKRKLKSPKGLTLFILFFYLFTALYSILISDASQLIKFVLDLGSFVILLLLVLTALDKDYYLKYLEGLVYGIFVSNIITLFGIIFNLPFRDDLFLITKEGIRLSGLYGNVNTIAAIQLLSISISLFFIFYYKGKRRLVFLINFFVAILTLILSQNRSAYLGLAIMLSLLVVLKWKEINLKKITIWLFSVTLILFFLINTFTNRDIFEGIKLARFSSENTSVSSVGYSDVETQRFFIWGAALETIIENPLGIGYSNPEIFIKKVTGVNLPSHNFVLSNLLALGIVFGMIMNIIFIYPVFRISRVRNSGNNLLFFIILGLIGFLTSALFHTLNNSIYLWIFIIMSYELLPVKIKYEKFKNKITSNSK